MSVNNVNRFLNIEDSHLRVVSGNVYAQALNVGGITVGSAHGLQNVTNVSNTTNNTIEFTNTETSLVTSGDINMLHSSNNAAIKLNSNVVTEFPRSKKLIRYPRVALTAASGESSGYQGYYVTESSNAANDLDRTSWKAFNMTFSTADPDDTWTNDEGTNYNGTDNTYNGNINLGTGAVNGEWIKLQLPHKIRLEYMKIWLRGDTDSTRIPEDWILYGSNDNLNWTPLLSITGQGAKNENQYSVNATSVYDYFAVVVTKISGQPDYFRIVELEYFGIPEYDPDAAGVDVKVTSYPNVPNTDWLEVYYDAKDLVDGAVTSVDDLTPSGTNDGTATNVTVSDGAFVFNGTNSNVTTGTTLSDGAYPHSVSLWYYTNDDPSALADYLFQLGDNTENNSPSININGATFYLSFFGNYLYNTVASTGIQTKKWVQISYSYDGGPTTANNPVVYIDGKQITMYGPLGNSAGSALSLVLGTDPNVHLTIGSRRNGTLPVNGKIANFRLFNRALTSDEIYQLYAYQKEYFGHGDLGMTLKAGRLGIGTSEPRAALDVKGDIYGGCPAAFSVAYDTTSLSGNQTIIWNLVYHNVGNGYDSYSGLFTAPVSGYYHFTVWGMTQNTASGQVEFQFMKNDSVVQQRPYGDAGSNYGNATGSIIEYLAVNDTMSIFLTSGTTMYASSTQSYNGFSGFYLSS